MVFRKKPPPTPAKGAAKPSPAKGAARPQRPAWMTEHVVDPSWVKNHMPASQKPPRAPEDIIADMVEERVKERFGGSILETDENGPKDSAKDRVREAVTNLIEEILVSAEELIPEDHPKLKPAREALANMSMKHVEEHPKFKLALAEFGRTLHDIVKGVADDVKTTIDQDHATLERAVWVHWIATESGSYSVDPVEMLEEAMFALDQGQIDHALVRHLMGVNPVAWVIT